MCNNSDREKEWKPKEALVDFAAKQVDGRWALVVNNSLFAYLFCQICDDYQKICFDKRIHFMGSIRRLQRGTTQSIPVL